MPADRTSHTPRPRPSSRTHARTASLSSSIRPWGAQLSFKPWEPPQPDVPRSDKGFFHYNPEQRGFSNYPDGVERFTTADANPPTAPSALGVSSSFFSDIPIPGSSMGITTSPPRPLGDNLQSPPPIPFNFDVFLNAGGTRSTNIFGPFTDPVPSNPSGYAVLWTHAVGTPYPPQPIFQPFVPEPVPPVVPMTAPYVPNQSLPHQATPAPFLPSPNQSIPPSLNLPPGIPPPHRPVSMTLPAVFMSSDDSPAFPHPDPAFTGPTYGSAPTEPHLNPNAFASSSCQFTPSAFYNHPHSGFPTEAVTAAPPTDDWNEIRDERLDGGSEHGEMEEGTDGDGVAEDGQRQEEHMEEGQGEGAPVDDQQEEHPEEDQGRGAPVDDQQGHPEEHEDEEDQSDNKSVKSDASSASSRMGSNFSLTDIFNSNYKEWLKSLASFMVDVGKSYSSGNIDKEEYDRLQDETMKQFLRHSLKGLITAIFLGGKCLSVAAARLVCADYLNSFDVLVMFATANHIDVHKFFADPVAVAEDENGWRALFSNEAADRIQANVVTTILVEVAEWWEKKIVSIFTLCKLVVGKEHLFPDLFALRGLPQPYLLALHRHTSSGLYLHLFRLRQALRQLGISTIFAHHMDSSAAWGIAVAIAYCLNDDYEYDLLRHGGLLLIVTGILSILSQDPVCLIAVVRFLHQKNPWCNAKPASAAGQQWSAIFAPASAFLSVVLAAMERDAWDPKIETLLLMYDLFKTKQRCTDEFITKICANGSAKEQDDMTWINEYARNQCAENLHPTRGDRSVSLDFCVTFSPADCHIVPPPFTSGNMASSSFCLNFIKMDPEDALERYGPGLTQSYSDAMKVGEAHHAITKSAIPIRHQKTLLRVSARATEAIANESFQAMRRANTHMAIQSQHELRRRAQKTRHIIPLSSRSHPATQSTSAAVEGPGTGASTAEGNNTTA